MTKRAHCFLELCSQGVCHWSAHWFLLVFRRFWERQGCIEAWMSLFLSDVHIHWGVGTVGMIIQPVRFGTAKITLVPELKDLHFPPGPFCKTSAPVHPGQPRLLLCVCVSGSVCVCTVSLLKGNCWRSKGRKLATCLCHTSKSSRAERGSGSTRVRHGREEENMTSSVVEEVLTILYLSINNNSEEILCSK